jgi:hypothetical protein
VGRREALMTAVVTEQAARLDAAPEARQHRLERLAGVDHNEH